MGNTVRREPVNFDIPASPNYKFLNITNFRGLDVSSNPFELATNTASDCLNVYVDETNTLTTRPRLCKKEFKNANGEFIVPLGGTCIGVYNLHNGYLLHHIIDDKPIMRLFVDGVLKDPVGGDIPATHCTHFEHGEDIYLLTGEDYLVIKDNLISKVEGYIPNKSIIRLDGTEELDEPLNVVSNKYTTRHYWNGVDKPDVELTSPNVKNNYLESVNLNLSHTKRLCHIYKDHSYIYYDTTLNTLFYVDCDTDFTERAVVNLNITLYDENSIQQYFAAGRDSKAFWFIRTETGRIGYCQINEDSSFEVTYPSITTITAASNNAYFVDVSHDNNRVLVNYTNNSVNRICVIDSFSKTRIVDIEAPAKFYNAKMTHVGESYYAVLLSANSHITSSKEFSTLYYLQDNGPLTVIDDSLEYHNWIDWSVTPTTGVIYHNYYDGVTIYKNFDVKTKEKIINFNSFGGKLSDDLSYFITLVDKEYSNEALSYYIKVYPDFPKLTNAYILPIETANPTVNWYHLIELKDVVVSQWWLINYNYPVTHIHIDNYANIIKTNELPSKEATELKLDLRNQQLTKATLAARFDNNYWFAKDNFVFISKHNDPTYFPITEYDDLGDANSPITGFNVANDTTLLAYKTDRVYLIQPFTSSLDAREYTVTESKNTVGNTAVGAPIVTTLTEIPLQINYDGIYGLSQLQNVSAVERIADLMSEPINDRWLNEDDVVIKKAMTLNRLYWTYIILPYESVTKIYLLDNRTNSWYYWELPIKLLEAFAKDNRAEFVDTEGNIYYLTTTDIKNAGFDAQLVTEYYDDGKKLINWFWQSQILPMGTMNYAKRLVNTTFILTDTDTQDGYGLKYNFKVFRKLASSTPEKEINDELNLVRSTTKKTNISKFGFIQLKISNITEESQGTEAEKAYRNNKLRLVGLGLKYVLLEGLIR